MRIILGLLKPTAGNALVWGQNLGENEDLRKKVGVLLEHDGLYERISAYENLGYYAQLYGVSNREKKIEKLLEFAGLSDRKNDKVGQFSKGKGRDSLIVGGTKNGGTPKVMQKRPVYTIGVVSELLSVHPETIRVWERYGVVQPQRRSGKRFYSENDLKRLRFIQRLIEEALNLPAIRHYLRLYPCWQLDGCPACMHRSELVCAKPCWKYEGSYCEVSGNEDTCSNCEFRKESNKCEVKQ